MIDALPVNILSFSPSGDMTYASKRYLERVGIPPHIRNFDTLARDVAHPEDFPVMFRRATDGFAAGTPFVNRFRRREKDGVYRWIEDRAHPLRDTDDTNVQRSEEHTSELQSLMRNTYAVFCSKKNKQ